MEKIKIILPVFGFVLLFGVANANAHSESDSTGLPGDHFSLYGALEMFKKSASIEDFETSINTKDNSVNNLDLDGDGNVDYISVIDQHENDNHAFVLQVAVSEKESQDIAIIELEKTGDESAVLQIIGDEDIYGESIIVEASDGHEENYDSEVYPYTQTSDVDASNRPATDLVVVNVWTWPTVRYVYGPRYTPWISPWHWRAYPGWYRPWRPLSWHVFHPLHFRYHHVGFRTVRTHRVVTAHRVYAPHRVGSVTVRKAHSTNLTHYRTTKTTRKATVVGPRGNEYNVKKSTTKVKGRDGQVKAKKTTVKVRKKH